MTIIIDQTAQGGLELVQRLSEVGKVEHQGDGIFSEREELIAARIKEAEDFLKAQTVAAGEKTVGVNFYVQYTRGGKQVKAEDVLRVADRFEKTLPEVAAELRSIVTMKKASATIKAVGT